MELGLLSEFRAIKHWIWTSNKQSKTRTLHGLELLHGSNQQSQGQVSSISSVQFYRTPEHHRFVWQQLMKQASCRNLMAMMEQRRLYDMDMSTIVFDSGTRDGARRCRAARRVVSTVLQWSAAVHLRHVASTVPQYVDGDTLWKGRGSMT